MTNIKHPLTQIIRKSKLIIYAIVLFLIRQMNKFLTFSCLHFIIFTMFSLTCHAQFYTWNPFHPPLKVYTICEQEKQVLLSVCVCNSKLFLIMCYCCLVFLVKRINFYFILLFHVCTLSFSACFL